MSPDAHLVLALALGVAVVVLGLLAWRGVISWGWVAAGVAALVGVTRRRQPSHRTPTPRPDPISAREPVDALLTAVDARADAKRAAIDDANEDADPDTRLDRLAGLRDGGRE